MAVSMRLSGALRAVALFEAAKGALVFVVGFGLLSLVHHDVQRFAERLIAHLHLNPAKGYPRIFVDAASQVTDTRLWMLAIAAMAYAFARFIESYGLWKARRWAEWFAALSGSIYVPFELREMYGHVTWLTIGALTLNVMIVVLMVYGLLQRSAAKSSNAA